MLQIQNKAWKRHVKLNTTESYDNFKEKLRQSVRLNKPTHSEFEKKTSYLKITYIIVRVFILTLKVNRDLKINLDH